MDRGAPGVGLEDLRVDAVRPARAAQAGSVARPGRLRDAACRTLDVVVSAGLLLVLSPVLALIALAIVRDSHGPAIFRQRRVGRDLEEFTVHKFRTMHHGAAHDVHREYVSQLIAGAAAPQAKGRQAQFKLVGDARLTSLGRFLRRTSLDELPQLWNVLRGEMSLVGPRPPIPYEVAQYPPHWLARFEVKPGMTGFWQVRGRSSVPLEEMVRMDIEYVQRRSLWLNLWILARTVPVVLLTRGAL